MSDHPMKASSSKFNRPQAAIVSILICAVLAAGTLAIAGTANLPFFWLVFLFEAVVAIVCIYILDPALLKERMKPQGKDEDRFGRLIVTVLYIFSVIIPALDVGRWHISDTVPPAVQIVGVVFNILGWAGVVWAMKINMYFSSAIRLQPDRNQQVITTGPYRLVRHPGYSFAALGFIGQNMMLGSWLGFIPIVLLIADFIYRSFLEEKILADGLPGYKAYMARVKFRWVPGLF